MTIPINLILFYSSALGASVILALCIFLIVTSKGFPIVKRTKKEKYFIDPNSGDPIKFPSINEEHSVNLSVIVPAYNEENRLPPMLEESVEYLEERVKKTDFSYEIIIVNDGSSDNTSEIVNKYSGRYGVDKIRLLELETNRGKGGAVRLGMQSARGAVLLFADADGATKFPDLSKLECALEEIIKKDYLKKPEEVSDKLAVVIGSRAHLEQDAIAKRNFFRTVLMHGFHFLVWLFTVRGLKDTQCGFKLFTREAARQCFDSVHVESWAFDVELLYIAQTLKIPISEISVTWTEIEGSKLTPVWSWIQMGKDLALIWLRYMIGAWKIKALHKTV